MRERCGVLVDVAVDRQESSQPSFSTSIHAVPKPVYGRLAWRIPVRALCSSNVARAVVHVQRASLADELGDEQILVAVRIEIAGIHAHVRLALARCAKRRARDERVLRNVPSRWLIHS